MSGGRFDYADSRMKDKNMMDAKNCKYPCEKCTKRKNCVNGCIDWKQWFSEKWREVTGKLKRKVDE